MGVYSKAERDKKYRGWAFIMTLIGLLFSAISGYFSISFFAGMGGEGADSNILASTTVATELLKAALLPAAVFMVINRVIGYRVMPVVAVVLWVVLAGWSYATTLGFFGGVTASGDAERYKAVQIFEEKKEELRKLESVINSLASNEAKRSKAERKIKRVKKLLIPAYKELNKWTNDDGSIATNSDGIPFRTYRAAAKAIVDDLNTDLWEAKQTIKKADKYLSARQRYKELEAELKSSRVSDGGETVSPGFVIAAKALNVWLPRTDGQPYTGDQAKTILISIIVAIIEISAAFSYLLAMVFSYRAAPKKQIKYIDVPELNYRHAFSMFDDTIEKTPAYQMGLADGLKDNKRDTALAPGDTSKLYNEGYNEGHMKRLELLELMPEKRALKPGMQMLGAENARRWIAAGADPATRRDANHDRSTILYGEDKKDFQIGWSSVTKEHNGFDIKLKDHENGAGAIRPSDENRSTELQPLLLSPWIREGEIVMLHGGEGLGKSMMMLAISNAIATGGELFSWSAPQPRSVLVIDPEMDASRNYNRMQAMGIETSNMTIIQADMIDPEDYPNPCTPEGRNFIDGKIRYFKPAIVWLDSISILTEGMMEAKAGEEFRAWMKQHKLRGLTIGFIHHDNDKNQQAGKRENNRLPSVRVHMLPRGKLVKDEINVDIQFEKTRDNMEAKTIHAQFKDGVWRDVGNVESVETDTPTPPKTPQPLRLVSTTAVHQHSQQSIATRPVAVEKASTGVLRALSVESNVETLKTLNKDDVETFSTLVTLPDTDEPKAITTAIAQTMIEHGYKPTARAVENVAGLFGVNLNRGTIQYHLKKLGQN